MVGGISLWMRGVIFPSDLRVVSPSSAEGNPGVLTLYYHHRPPYYHETSRGLEGVVIDPVVAALAAAEIDFQWVPLPAPQQLEAIRRNDGPVAAVGWFFFRRTGACLSRSTCITTHPKRLHPSACQ